jgi:glutamine synthetase adenylyltransferase
LGLNSEKLKDGCRLENFYLEELYELLNDEESCVRIEAIEASIEVLDVMGLENVEKKFMPPLLKMLNLKSNAEEVLPRMSKLIGKIVHKLTKDELHLKYKEAFLSYFSWISESEDDGIRLNAAYNLPAF